MLPVRLHKNDEQELERVARQWGRTPGDAGATLIQEGLRRHQCAGLDFRQTPTGRHAYIAGTRLAVWQIIQIARRFKNDVERTAKHLGCPASDVRAAQNYAKAYPEEIESAIEDCEGEDFESLSRLIPGLK